MDRKISSVLCRADSRLVLYTKPNCPLCTKLQSQIEGLLIKARLVQSSLADVTLETKDVTSDPEMDEIFVDEVPFLVKVTEEGEKERLPRFTPRTTVERLEKKLEQIFDRS